MIEPQYLIDECLKEFKLKALPSNIEIQYKDSVEFFNLKSLGIPEDYLTFPVITNEENGKSVIYVNYIDLNNSTYYTSELFVSQLIKLLIRDSQKNKKNNLLIKNTLFLKKIELGYQALSEYKEIEILIKIMNILYNSKKYELKANNPYRYKQNKKIAREMFVRAINNKTESQLSCLLYSMAKLSHPRPYDFSIIIKDQMLLESFYSLYNLLLSTDIYTCTKEELNKIGLAVDFILKSKI